jgi:hypothetical protein
MPRCPPVAPIPVSTRGETRLQQHLHIPIYINLLVLGV